MGGIVLSLSWGSRRDRQREGEREGGEEKKEKERGREKKKVKQETKKRTRGREKRDRRSLVDRGIRGGVNHRPFLVVSFFFVPGCGTNPP